MRVWAYDLAPDGTVSGKRLFHQFPDHGLDGMRCDIAGNLYVTRWGKGTVAKLSPSGELLQEIVFGGSKCTNIAFGGPDGRTCYVTVADQGNVERFRAEFPGRSWGRVG
jgi:sugar lactone lactonase YvrE